MNRLTRNGPPSFHRLLLGLMIFLYPTAAQAQSPSGADSEGTPIENDLIVTVPLYMRWDPWADRP